MARLQCCKMPPPHQSIQAWAAKTEGALVARSSPKIRQRLSRLRSSNDSWMVCPRVAGRRLKKVVARKSLHRRSARWRVLGQQRLLALIQQFVRLRVIVKTSVHEASDHRRMMRLTHALRGSGASDSAVVLILLFDRAMRRPTLSSALARAFRKAVLQDGCGSQGAWQAVRTVRRVRLAQTQNAQYWKGPAALHALQMIRTWKKNTVVPVVEGIAAHSGSLDAITLMPLLESLPHMTAYGSFHFLRSLRWALGIPLRNDAQFATQMSHGLAVVSQVAPLHQVLQTLRARRPPGRGGVSSGDAALVLCETCKACVVLGILDRDLRTWSTDTVLRACRGPAASMLLQCLQKMTPISLAQVQKVTCRRAREAEEVNTCVPQTSEPWDAFSHFCKGSEMLVPCLQGQLRRFGWRRHVKELPPRFWN